MTESRFIEDLSFYSSIVVFWPIDRKYDKNDKK